jgi:hypothetical protein
MDMRSSSTERYLAHQQLEGDREYAGSHHRRLLLVDGPSWVGHEIKHNDEANLIIIDGTLILCGSKVEYQTLIRLLQDPLECVPFSDLMPSFEYQRDRKALGKRIQKLRRKLPPKLTIGCEIGAGYVLREKSHENMGSSKMTLQEWKHTKENGYA